MGRTCELSDQITLGPAAQRTPVASRVPPDTPTTDTHHLPSTAPDDAQRSVRVTFLCPSLCPSMSRARPQSTHCPPPPSFADFLPSHGDSWLQVGSLVFWKKNQYTVFRFFYFSF